ncbi:DUF4383 domain-containing protein [uncultured Jatrophihabitans sp.]|uniref:DUF4383 domain-containing protein n=1 Tax=uncultured Jatrophihabitans sp. TaxID=1610747 RepID=UPI0035CC2CBF
MASSTDPSAAAPPDQEGPSDFDKLREPLIGRLSMQAVALLFAAVFVLVGILGFLPGITQHLLFSTGPRFSGEHSHAMLFGVFMVSVLHNLVHIAYGAIGAVASFFAGTVRVYFFAGGLVYLALFVYGLVIDQHTAANFVPVNTADNFLHLGLGLLMILTGLVLHVRLNRMSAEEVRDSE